MSKEITFKLDNLTKLQTGVNTLAEAVKVTLGPNGSNVMIERPFGRGPHITKDGVTVAKSITLKDPVENMGAQLTKEVSSRANDLAGDGTTTTVVLAQALVNAGVERIFKEGLNPVAIRRELDEELALVVRELDELAVPIELESEQLEFVATISANNDEELGKQIADAFRKVGTSGVVTAEESKKQTTYVEVIEGAQYDCGFVTPHFVNRPERMLSELDEALVVVAKKRIQYLQEVLPAMNYADSVKKPLVVVALETDSEALNNLVINHTKGILPACVINAPGYGDEREDFIDDISYLTGAIDIADPTINVEDPRSYVGVVKKIITKQDTTTFVCDSEANSDNLKGQINFLKGRAEQTNDEEVSKYLKQRAERLGGGVAVVYVGGKTLSETKERKDRVDDAICAVKAALEEGIVAGGGVTLNYLSRRQGILGSALKAPLQTLEANSGLTGSPKDVTPYRGLNLKTLEEGDMIEMGIVDPKKVTRIALESAVSIASLILTTACSITEEREPEENDN